ncbi:MAG: orotidine-5'-phosphate decarboxylase [Patescibacteria group bacterium]|nr:orotidine-5'-phosphate decarboxylase [Patescibacteria group bacterium]
MQKSRNFRAMLEKKWDEGKHICVGLDPDMEKIPQHIKDAAVKKTTPGQSSIGRTIIGFCRAIVHATKDLVCAFKPNIAFFEAFGPEGFWIFADVVKMVRDEAPDVVLIGDMKRADIGNTNKGYATGAFEWLGVDAITVNPYFGGGSLAPFLDFEKREVGINRGDCGVIVLCRTSNPEAAEFQDRLTLVLAEDVETERGILLRSGVTNEISKAWSTVTLDGKLYCAMPHYQWVALRFASRWSYNGNCALVVGATAPQELADVRALVGDLPLLIPGIGFQQKGVPIEDQIERAVNAGRDSRGRGFILNDSRGTLYASSGDDFTDAARARVNKLNELVRQNLK